MASRQRVQAQPAFLLHYTAYRETSLIVEAYSREHGRLPLLAKGARRPHSAFRGVLMAFQPLLLSWSGRGEVRTLAVAEWMGGQPLLTGRALLCGYYLNELLIRLLPREDAHPGLFDAYALALHGLATGEGEAAVLRRFEFALLRELGYGAPLNTEADHATALRPQARYAYIIEQGPVPDDGHSGEITYTGHALLAMARDDYSDPETLVQAKSLLRRLLGHYLGTQALDSRRIFMELQEL